MKRLCVYCFRNLVATSIDILKEKIRNNIHDLTAEARITENSGDFYHFYLYRKQQYELVILKSNNKITNIKVDPIDIYNNLNNLEEWLNDKYKYIEIYKFGPRDEYILVQQITRNGTKIPKEWK